MQEAQLSLSLAGNASFHVEQQTASYLMIYDTEIDTVKVCFDWISEGPIDWEPPHGFSDLYSPINASNKHLCLPLSLFNPFAVFFFPALFNVLPSHLHTQPSLLSHPPLHSPIHLSIYPSIPFGGALSGTLGLFIKASKPTASNTQPLERKRGGDGEIERGRWREKWGAGGTGGRQGECEEQGGRYTENDGKGETR